MKVNYNIINFYADKTKRNPVTGEYKDPLMHWPLRGAAFTNEIGEALRPLIGNYATLSWAPALLYIGADIYDKYKNDQTEYSPDSQRCLEQAFFQGLASILLPLVAVNAGQNILSLFGLLSKDKITINSKEHILELARNFVANGNMRAFSGLDNECVKKFADIVFNNMDFIKQSEVTPNPIKSILLKFEDYISRMINIDANANFEKYAEKTIKELINLRRNILEQNENFKKSDYYNNYGKAIKAGQTKNVAVKTVLNKYLLNLSLKGRLIKTIGGFIALGVLIKPIDSFVEEVLITKVVSPSFDKIKKPT